MYRHMTHGPSLALFMYGRQGKKGFDTFLMVLNEKEPQTNKRRTFCDICVNYMKVKFQRP